MNATTELQDQPLHPVLKDLWLQTERIKADVRELVGTLSDAQFNWRPGPSRWSIGECIGHLNTFEGSLTVIDRLIGQARERGLPGQGPYRTYWFGRFFINVIEPPYRLRVKTFRSMVPPSGEPVDRVVPMFLSLQDQLQQRIRQADGLDLGGVSARNPSKVRLTLGQWFLFLLAHERRHLWQARNVAGDPRFPR